MFTNLTESWIRDQCKERIFNRGQTYYEEDRVQTVSLQDDRLRALVEGTPVEPYQVEVELEENSLSFIQCSCPSEIPGICKHAVATLLFCLENPEQVHDQKSLETIVSETEQER
ncbi:MAG: SWIM zinc finger domain-containing protein, partial [bacterium]